MGGQFKPTTLRAPRGLEERGRYLENKTFLMNKRIASLTFDFFYMVYRAVKVKLLEWCFIGFRVSRYEGVGWVLVKLNHLGNFKEIQIVIMRAFDFEVRISQENRDKTLEDKLIFPLNCLQISCPIFRGGMGCRLIFPEMSYPNLEYLNFIVWKMQSKYLRLGN